MTSNDTSVLCRMSQLATLPWNEEFYLIWSCECVLSSFACVPCVATMPDPFRGFVNHTIVYPSVTGTRLKIGQNCNISTSLKTHANLGKTFSSRNNFHILVSLSWKVHTTNLPFPPFFTLHVGKVGILKRQMDSFIGFTKKECPDRAMSCDPVDHLGERKGKAIRHRFDLLA